MTSLDQFFGATDLGRLKAIKMDAEGAEFAILVGAKGLLARHRIPFVIAEVNRFGLEAMGASEQLLRGLMSDLGYDTWLLQPGQTQAVKLAPTDIPETNAVFNVLFRHREAPALAA